MFAALVELRSCKARYKSSGISIIFSYVTRALIFIAPIQIISSHAYIIFSTLDQCRLEKCYVQMQKRETELEVTHAQGHSFEYNQRNLTDNRGSSFKSLELISKDCHLSELKCSMCNGQDECSENTATNQPPSARAGPGSVKMF